MDNSIQPPHAATIEVEQHLRQLNDEWVKALVRGDGETLERIMADDFLFTYPLEGDDKAQFIADVTAGDLKIEHISREQVSVRVFGSTAVLTARDSATWLYHGRELSGQYKIIQVYSERNGQWQLCAVQACPMAQPDAHAPGS
ncbi:MAG TPA: nuclear transport factor 2 family protein [Pyrinomonadaceae bacterium]|nr:nuclear transport factor 2 family protein [Pyrinomonadaceae bacterium]